MQYLSLIVKNNKQVSYDYVFQETYSLEQACGGSSVFSTHEKAESMLMNLLMPLCLRVGSGRKGNFVCHLFT